MQCLFRKKPVKFTSIFVIPKHKNSSISIVVGIFLLIYLRVSPHKEGVFEGILATSLPNYEGEASTKTNGTSFISQSRFIASDLSEPYLQTGEFRSFLVDKNASDDPESDNEEEEEDDEVSLVCTFTGAFVKFSALAGMS